MQMYSIHAPIIYKRKWLGFGGLFESVCDVEKLVIKDETIYIVINNILIR